MTEMKINLKGHKKQQTWKRMCLENVEKLSYNVPESLYISKVNIVIGYYLRHETVLHTRLCVFLHDTIFSWENPNPGLST
jgi:hypothetical protein